MTNNRSLRILCLGLGLTLLIVGLVPFAFAQDDPTEEPTVVVTEASAGVDEQATEPAPVETEEPVSDEELSTTGETAPQDEPSVEGMPEGGPTGDNSYCAICHNQPMRVVTLADGYALNLYVPPDALHNSVHRDLGCVDCHGEDAFPHNDPTPIDNRVYTIDSVTMCESCHEDASHDLSMGLHHQAIMEGNLEAAVCTDCHGAHDVQRVAREPQLVAGICGDCHVNTVSEWRVSPHVDIGPLGCATCHQPHRQTIRGEYTANELCINCHKAMPDQWIHSQHIGVAYGEKEVGCVDCHMYVHPTDNTQTVSLNPDDLLSGHSMIVDTASCTTCHEQAGDLPVSQVEPPTADVTVPEVREGGENASTLIDSNVTDPDQELENAETTDLVPLIQGLLLGLGVGATFAAIFVARGNRRHD